LRPTVDSRVANAEVIVNFTTRRSRAASPHQVRWVMTSPVEEVEDNMRESIEFPLEGMRLHGDEIPIPLPIVKTVNLAS
jgi:hypothetical protein